VWSTVVSVSGISTTVCFRFLTLDIEGQSMVNMKNAYKFLALKTLREIRLEDLGVHEIIILKVPGISRVRI